MKRRKQILIFLFAAGMASAPVWAQSYPPPQQYPPQQQYPQQQPYPQQPGYGQEPVYGQQPPYYGQEPAYGAQPPSYPPQQLDSMVGRIALYPDPLLTQVLTASTFSNQIPDADAWARAHAYLSPDAMTRAIQDDGLPWDPSVLALLPFPQVLDMMAGDMAWTQDVGNSVLANRAAVMDAVQRQRALARDYGYLQSNAQIRVVDRGPGDIEIIPADPAYVYVPYYNPYVVYAPATWILRGKRNYVRTARADRRICALGLGTFLSGLARTPHHRERPPVGADMGKPAVVRASLSGAAAAVRSPRGAARASGISSTGAARRRTRA